jgi:hypothetical protein
MLVIIYQGYLCFQTLISLSARTTPFGEIIHQVLPYQAFSFHEHLPDDVTL